MMCVYLKESSLLSSVRATSIEAVDVNSAELLVLVIYSTVTRIELDGDVGQEHVSRTLLPRSEE